MHRSIPLRWVRFPPAPRALSRQSERCWSCSEVRLAECLRRFDSDVLPEVFDCTDITPRERLLAAFDVHSPLCPFIAAAVEIADSSHPARVYARDYKQAFAARLAETAREAGAISTARVSGPAALFALRRSPPPRILARAGGSTVGATSPTRCAKGFRRISVLHWTTRR